MLEKHSTETETANANASLVYWLRRFSVADFIEVLDNAAAVSLLRSMACKSQSMQFQMDWRRNILATLLPGQRVFTLWSRREGMQLKRERKTHSV